MRRVEKLWCAVPSRWDRKGESFVRRPKHLRTPTQVRGR